MKLRKSLLALLLVVGLGSTSCLGPDNLYNSVKNWNANLSEKDWVNEVVFLAFVIIPVYPIALFGDVVIFNTVEYWSGDNLVKAPEAFPGFTRKDNAQ